MPLRIMAWNIAEGRSEDRNLPPNIRLPFVATQILIKSPVPEYLSGR